MALIWAEGFTGESALAPAWLEMSKTTAKRSKLKASDGIPFLDASKAEELAVEKYATLVRQAEDAMKNAAIGGKPRTHIMIVGVGEYDSKDVIPTVTTSVNGARKFAEWALTQFSKADRPLGSIEFLCSATPEQGEWIPEDDAAKALGFTIPCTALSAEPATFENIRKRFGEWLERSGTMLENAAIWYFAGHGIFKSEPTLFAQDARLPTNDKEGGNLIATIASATYLQNRMPSVQCFFVDACSEYNFEAIANQLEVIGRPLCTPVNGAAIAQRDASIYFGSYAGGKAYGSAKDAPYFTQELIRCLTQRAGDPTFDGSPVTMSSLASALKAAAMHRAETEGNSGIIFSESKPGVVNTTGVLCDLVGPPEVLVKVRCSLGMAMSAADLFVTEEAPGKRRLSRAKRRDALWCTPVPSGKWAASAAFDTDQYESGLKLFEPRPPVSEVIIDIKPSTKAPSKPDGTKP
ncbi:caspase family protein [Bradyrhizobium sp. Arg816]|uniref:caspase family protein n=1 Tax=Bradyrhizobium sp. Arg816 TaxID=2998491 RepID=UPI00249E3C77|nr:caspase family protein [Bradyrhizobium sp. Arg816]MDI3566611.1 caspase family protein [Bradyrhizobium sp. Arg816]